MNKKTATANELKVYYIKKAKQYLIDNNIEDPTGSLAQKCAKEAFEFIKGERKS